MRMVNIALTYLFDILLILNSWKYVLPDTCMKRYFIRTKQHYAEVEHLIGEELTVQPVRILTFE